MPLTRMPAPERDSPHYTDISLRTQHQLTPRGRDSLTRHSSDGSVLHCSRCPMSLLLNAANVTRVMVATYIATRSATTSRDLGPQTMPHANKPASTFAIQRLILTKQPRHATAPMFPAGQRHFLGLERLPTFRQPPQLNSRRCHSRRKHYGTAGFICWPHLIADFRFLS
jgi:hypothetical protein